MKKKIKRVYLAPDVLLRMVLTKDASLLAKAEEKGFELVTSDFGFYEVMMCLDWKEIRKHADMIRVVFKGVKCVHIGLDSKPAFPDVKRIKHLRKIAEV